MMYASIDEIIDRTDFTNGDRIRALSDEELAKEFNRHFRCPPMQPRHCPDMPCYGCWLDWLKQPVEEDT